MTHPISYDVQDHLGIMVLNNPLLIFSVVYIISFALINKSIKFR